MNTKKNSRIELVIFTVDDISTYHKAKVFFDSLEEIGLSPEFIGEFEPIKTPYSSDQAISIWCKQDSGCYDVDQGRNIGIAGGLIARNRSRNVWYQISWWQCPTKKYISWVSISLPSKLFISLQNHIVQLFELLIIEYSALYGYIGHIETVERQHAAGTLVDRIPGIFWCNYFSKVYVDFFAKQKMLSFPWYDAREINDGLLLFLDAHPYENIIANQHLEDHARRILGYDSFANHEEEMQLEREKFSDIRKYMNTDYTQHKNVPDILA